MARVALALGVACLAGGVAGEGAVVGYLPEWRYLQWPGHEQEYRWGALCEHVTHLILFSIEVAGDGSLRAMDRFPNKYQLAMAKEQCQGRKLLICFGGNARTHGFPQMVAGRNTRAAFLRNLKELVDEHGLDGVDYNWEYPKTPADWHGLEKLVKETRAFFDDGMREDFVITVAYYPDGAQEPKIAAQAPYVNYFLTMCYDQPGEHATWAFTEKCVARAAPLPKEKVALGLPFYSRNVKTGEWKTYEDLWKSKKGFGAEVDKVGDDYFNGRATIRRKTEYAIKEGLGGVMIWEVGQDTFSNKKKSLLKKASLLEQVGAQMRHTYPSGVGAAEEL
eukprot:TRINITY_DN24891_c0_g1_i1.p1 TRINITY_DN24891_c0_g1~~TRINITY_DN24891_c0_g1_i1.p1  ORF type:complete len:334 (+),score=115.32 TRINITY_DN24891_c0_g1_i1:57-1058(+)